MRFLFPYLAIILAAAPAITPVLLAQGPLTPTGAPAATMRTLAQIEPRTPIESLPADSTAQYVINSPGAYYLSSGSINGTSGKAAIAINSNGVTIDLNGFSLIGAGSATRGIEIRGAFANLAVRNGGISGWSAAGIGLSTGNGPSGVILEGLTIASITGPGIDLTQGIGVSVSQCSITDAGAGILLGNTGAVHACAVSNIVGTGGQIYGIYAGAVTDCDVNSVTGSGSADCYGILARTVQGCSVISVNGAGNGLSIGIQAESITGSAANIIGATSNGVSEGMGANVVSSCSVSSVGGAASTSVQYGIESSGTVSDCTVANMGNSSSSALMYGIDAKVVSRCHVTSISTNSTIYGIFARVVNASVVSNLVQLGAASGGNHRNLRRTRFGLPG